MTKIVLIGAGNLGFHLGKAILKSKLDLVQVFSRKIEHAQSINADCAVNQWAQIIPNADLYIIATPDDTIEQIAKQLSQRINEHALVVHVSGAKSSKILEPFFKHYGSLYPLQSFSKEKKVNFENIPICVVGKTKSIENRIKKVAKQLSNHVYMISDEDRLTIHVSAVFVNNFANYLFQIGHEILDKNNIPFDIILPLIEETVEKIKTNHPKAMQTGPAIRGDQKTIQQHLDFLSKKPKLRKLYVQLTQGINPNWKQ